MSVTTGTDDAPGTAAVRVVGEWSIVRLAGEVDVACQEVLTAAVDDVVAATEDGAPSVYVDLSGVTFLDSSGVAALAAMYRAARSHGGGFVVTGATGGVARVLEVTGLHELTSDPADAPSEVRAS